MPIDSISSTDGICRTDDLFVRHVPRWVVELDDGSTIYGDDDRPGLPPGRESAWLRLREHCHATGLSIVRMRLQFRSTVVPLPEGRPGYYFSRGACGVWGDPETRRFFVAGAWENGRADVALWSLPELSPYSREVRIVDPNDPRLIPCRIERGRG